MCYGLIKARMGSREREEERRGEKRRGEETPSLSLRLRSVRPSEA
jgi:hypothetical protein